MIRFIFRGDDEKATERFAVLSVEMLRAGLEAQFKVQSSKFEVEEAKVQPGTLNLEPGTRLLGPAPCPIAKLRGKYRYHALLFSLAPDEVRKVVGEIVATFDPPENVQWVVDVDPMDLM